MTFVINTVGDGVSQVMHDEFGQPHPIGFGRWRGGIEIYRAARGEPAPHQRRIDSTGHILDGRQILDRKIDRDDMVHQDAGRGDPAMTADHALVFQDGADVIADPRLEFIDVLNGLRRREAVLNDINLHFSYGFPSLSLILSEAPHTETGRLSTKDAQPPLLPRKTIFKSA